jgi:galactokinase
MGETEPSPQEIDIGRTVRCAVRSAREVWGPDWNPIRGAVAPGRIEILGNHVDYNGGPVLAGAVDRATVILSDDADELEVLFADLPGDPVFVLDPSWAEIAPQSPGSPTSADYILGTIAQARMKSRPTRGGRVVIATSVPIGAGMSSSAALCVATTLHLNDHVLDRVELIYDAQAAENWTGVPCGTMDQTASVFGHVIRYEGPEGTHSISPDLKNYRFVVVDSRVKRTLGTSSYAERVQECAEAVRLLEQHLNRPVGYLGALSSDELDLVRDDILPDPLAARARHVVTEIERVARGEAAMRAGDWETFGELMNASGISSAGDYEISHPQVEALVAAMREVPGVVGARMMGGGEGGSTLALLRTDALDDLREAVSRFCDDRAAASSIVPLSFAPGARLLTPSDIESLAQ